MKNKKHVLSQYISELIGTFLLVFFGCGSAILSQKLAPQFNPLVIPLIFGGIVSVMIYAVGHISGAHFNPAVTIAFWAVKRFPTYRVPGYIFAQCLGAIGASLAHLYFFGSEGHNFGLTTVINTTELSLGYTGGFLIEALLSFTLMFVIISVATDSRAVGELAGIAIGSTVAIDAALGGILTGASMNPARSLAPAIVKQDYTFLSLYIIAPIVGTVIAAKVYEWIRCHREEEAEHGCC
jgi:aquaporin NIP